MHALVNLRHLEKHSVGLTDELAIEELDIDTMDDLIQIHQPLDYDLEVQLVDSNLLVQGSLRLVLDCECARCLKPHQQIVNLDPWVCHIPLSGEDAAPVANDSVDLTPYIREDIVLAFPQHPLCEPECKGMERPDQDASERGIRESDSTSPAWAELNKLKL